MVINSQVFFISADILDREESVVLCLIIFNLKEIQIEFKRQSLFNLLDQLMRYKCL